MNKNAKQAFANKIASIAKGATLVTWPMPDPNALVFISRSDVDFGFDQTTYDQFEEIISGLLKNHGWSEKFSEEFLRNALIEIVAHLIKSPTDSGATQLFDKLAHAYEAFADENVVHIPLGGINLQIDELQIGKIRLKKITRDSTVGLFSELDARSPNNKAWARQLSDTKEKFFGEDSATEVLCAECSVVAEPRRAEERAMEECSRILELLRFSIPTLYEDYLRVEIGYLWEIVEMQGAIVTLHAQKPHFQCSPRNFGPASDFAINKDSILELESMGVIRVGRILAKSPKELTEFEKTILQTIHWFGTSVRQPDIENKFLNLLISLETLFTPKSKDPIATAISEGVAFVLGNDFQKRTALKKRMKNLYSIRSGLSHGGQKEILEIDLSDLREIATNCIRWAIQNVDNFQSREDLFSWIEKEKLT